MMVVSSAGVNISRQFSALNEARKKNYEYVEKINYLSEANNKLNERLAYATSSAYLDQQARDKFGLGTTEDAWLDLKPEAKVNLLPKMNIGDAKPKYQQWFSLFTK